jgi:hypothetical protein
MNFAHPHSARLDCRRDVGLALLQVRSRSFQGEALLVPERAFCSQRALRQSKELLLHRLQRPRAGAVLNL